MKRRPLALTLTLTVTLALVAGTRTAAAAEGTPAEALAGVYSAIADSILASKASERAIVLAILQSERDHALHSLAKAEGKGGTADDLRAAAARLGDFATEGGAAVEPIRARLLAGGHHHHADDTGPDAAYDEGYVVLTRKLKQEALALAKRCAMAAETGKVDAKEVAAIREALRALAAKALAAE
jgi:hypothetical protein